MSYRHTLEAAMESLYEIEDLLKSFPPEQNIPAIEMDLALQKIRNLYELLLMLKKETITQAHLAKEKPNETRSLKTAVAGTEEVVSRVVSSQPSPMTGKMPATKQTVADQFKGRPTLHEILHQDFSRESETLAHAKPVADLLAAIGINDRFTFIRELFKNDTAAFEQAILVLNEASSFNDAYNFMIQHFDWDMDSEPVQQLLDIVRRKFIKGKHE